MIEKKQQIDHKNSCLVFSLAIQKALLDLLNIETNFIQKSSSVPCLENHEDLFFSILFTGEVYGEFMLGLNKIAALKMLGIEHAEGDELEAYRKNRLEIVDSFKEIINIASAKTLNEFKPVFPNLSITPPKAIEGQIFLSAYPIEKTKLFHVEGAISCYIYIDYMQLEIADSFFKDRSLLMEQNNFANDIHMNLTAHSGDQLSQPLNTLLHQIDTLKKIELDKNQKEQFEMISKTGAYLLTLIRDFESRS